MSRIQPFLTDLLSDRYGCDAEDITMYSTLDDLNLSADDRSDIAFILSDVYAVDIPAEAVDAFETVEDVIGYVEDRLS